MINNNPIYLTWHGGKEGFLGVWMGKNRKDP